MTKLNLELISRTYRLIEDEALLEPDEVVLIGISGGPDSVALTLILREINRRHSRHWRLILAHLNHGIRGKEALRDEQFVKDFSRQMGLPFYTKHISISGRNLEAKAREKRYRFLSEIARKTGATSVAVGHTLDDQAETVLLRLLRGTALKGLRGIQPRRPILPESKIMLIRPLLHVGRKDVINYLKENRQSYCTDSTNLHQYIRRNKIRLDLLPYLEKYHKEVRKHLARIGETSRQTYDYVEAQAQEFLEKNISSNGIPVKALRKLHPAVRSEVINQMIKRVKGDSQGINFAHYQAIDSLIMNAPLGKEVILPGNIIISSQNDLIKVQGAKRKVQIYKPENRNKPLTVRIPGETLALPYSFKIKTTLIKNTNDYLKKFRRTKTNHEEIFDYDSLELPLQVRYRRQGDKFQPLGMSGTQTLKKFFIDRKINKKLRDKVPLIVSKGRIIWVVGQRISETAKVTAQTKTILRINVSLVNRSFSPQRH